MNETFEKTRYFDIGLRILELRSERKLSQEQLALRSNITPTYLGMIERNDKNPTLKVVEQICDALNISLAEFFAESQPRSSETDNYSLQILSQIEPCTNDEKAFLLRMIKYVIQFKELGK